MAAPYEISHDWEEPEELHELLQAIRDQRDNANLRKIRYAYYLAEWAHRGQSRCSGEAFIHHPLAVTRILVDLKMDDDTIAAALLHDVLEDSSEIKPDRIATEFGEHVLALVEGVTRRSTFTRRLPPVWEFGSSSGSSRILRSSIFIRPNSSG
jgi:guanosine-3',5'-bis(diphosphate) 3'-pyrophosphohydrolase